MRKKQFIEMLCIYMVIVLFLITGCQQIHREIVQAPITLETQAQEGVDNISIPEGLSHYPGPTIGDSTAAIAANEQASDSLRQSDWWRVAIENILSQEYNLSTAETPAQYQAPNRSQNLRIYFDTDGIRISPRSKNGINWQMGLGLTGYRSK